MDYLLFFVGGEDRLSLENEERITHEMFSERQKLAKVQQTQDTNYIWLTQIQVKKDKDYGNDEFELYYSSSYTCESWGPFQSSTNFRFDGGSHTDFSGYSRSFPDINGEGTYEPSHAIAVATYSQFKLDGIEDDHTAGAHKNDHTSGGKHQENGMDFIELDLSDDGYTEHEDWSFWFSIHDDVTNDDDIYNDGLIRYTGYGAPPEDTHNEYVTSDINYWLRLGTVSQADEW